MSKILDSETTATGIRTAGVGGQLFQETARSGALDSGADKSARQLENPRAPRPPEPGYRDAHRALGFYRDVLGFDVLEGAAVEGSRRVSVSPPSQPDMHIVLEQSGSQPGIPPTDRAPIEDLMTEGMLGRLVFVTDNCDDTFERIEAAGDEVMQEPINRPAGERDCAFLDPSGNLLRFTQPAAGSLGIRVPRGRTHGSTS